VTKEALMETNNLSKVISPGSLIKTKVNDSEWIANVAYKVYDDCIEMELFQEYIDKKVFVGDEISCKFSTPDTEYMLFGTIKRIFLEAKMTMIVNINKIKAFKNARRDRRYDTFIMAKMITPSNGEFFCILNNISSSSVSILSKVALDVDTIAKIELFVDVSTVLSFDGKVARATPTHNGYGLGIRIVDIDEKSKHLLHQTINKIKKSEENLINKYLSNIFN
jgi:hypothetical protein